jgi:hypothetical protein
MVFLVVDFWVELMDECVGRVEFACDSGSYTRGGFVEGEGCFINGG